MSSQQVDYLVIGGGAAGFFAAINYALSLKNKGLAAERIVILEKSNQLLKKVKISGGGRCNVTHACFETQQLVKFYPRGSKELLSAFMRFNPSDTVQWFKQHKVALKIEDDGRIFPTSNQSQTIIDCFISLANRLNIEIVQRQSIQSFEPLEAFSDSDLEKKNDTSSSCHWLVKSQNQHYYSKKLVLATGGNAQGIFEQLKKLDLSISPLIPSLFTFNTKDRRLHSLSGVAVANATVRLCAPSHDKGKKVSKRQASQLQQNGALLITHWGLSGPAVLKMSAVSALKLHELGYKFNIQVDWISDVGHEEVEQKIRFMKTSGSNKGIVQNTQFGLPKRLWSALAIHTGIAKELTWAEASNKQLQALSNQLKCAEFIITGKSTNKDEFVTCGGLDLTEINFKDFSVKKYPHLYAIGELLNIDALTGGFNFQAAWTGGYLAASAASNSQ